MHRDESQRGGEGKHSASNSNVCVVPWYHSFFTGKVIFELPQLLQDDALSR